MRVASRRCHRCGNGHHRRCDETHLGPDDLAHVRRFATPAVGQALHQDEAAPCQPVERTVTDDRDVRTGILDLDPNVVGNHCNGQADGRSRRVRTAVEDGVGHQFTDEQHHHVTDIGSGPGDEVGREAARLPDTGRVRAERDAMDSGLSGIDDAGEAFCTRIGVVMNITTVAS